MVVGFVFAAAFLSLGIRLVDLATRAPLEAARSSTRGAALAAEGVSDVPDPRRADIVDRQGHLLATNIVTLSVTADPAKVLDARRTAVALAGALDGVDEADLLRRLERGGRFVWVKRHISPREQAAIQDLGLPGVAFTDSEMRAYPNGNLVSHVLGFVDIDNQGLAGLEYGLQRDLVGGEAEGKEPLRLALDLRVQEVVHDQLARAVTDFRALGGCALVLDVHSRELVSLVSLPDFDPNHPERAPADARTNRCTGNVYELGSVFKIVTSAMALESGRVSLYDRFDASEPLKIGRHTIRDDHGKWRVLAVPEIFAFSSNIGTAQMAFAAGGPAVQQPFLESLGLTDKPKLDIPETQAPLVPAKWIDIVSATVSYGHGIAVAPLQFAESVAALVGDGRFARTRFLDAGEGAAPSGPRVVSEETVQAMRLLLWLTVDRGTGTNGHTQGYLVGGKTGTADKPADDRRGYERGAVIASFVGAFPIDQPRYVVMVTLDEPQGNDSTFGWRYGGWTAAPVVADIVAIAGPLLGVEPTRPAIEASFDRQMHTIPVVNGRTHREEEGFEVVRLAR
ncbi:MAG: penicillin-binding protein 2 [Geminicoccaceae bacterium]|nr:penicillin-binding protein 2 [Geminicoccaceae bacterium]